MGYDPIEVNQAAAKATREIRKDGGAGYSEPNVFTFDGKSEGKVEIADTRLYKISDKIPDVSDFVACRGFLQGSVLELSAVDCTIKKESEVGSISVNLDGTGDSCIVCVIYSSENIFNVKPGLYVMCYSDNDTYVSYIEFAETIHPIDPKYLPGVCLPVVELSTVATNGAVFSEADNVKLTTAKEKGTPAVISCTIDHGDGTLNSGQFVFNCSQITQNGSVISDLITTSTAGIVVAFSKLNENTIWTCEIVS